MLERFQGATLKLKLNKCSFTQSKVKIFGHLVNGTDIKISFDNLKEVLEASTVPNVTGLRIFLGLSGSYWRPISNLADKSTLLHATTFVNSAFEWTPEMQEDF